jgi:hypothetical protein
MGKNGAWASNTFCFFGLNYLWVLFYQQVGYISGEIIGNLACAGFQALVLGLGSLCVCPYLPMAN